MVQSLKENKTLKNTLDAMKNTPIPVAVRMVDTGIGMKLPYIESSTVGEVAGKFSKASTAAKDDAYQLAKGSGGSGVSKEGSVAKGTGEAIGKITIPSIRNGEFNKWFDELSSKEFNKMWENPKLRKRIEDRIRRPGGYHEWHLVARTPKFKEWGISMNDIKEMRTLTKDVKFVNPPGVHGGEGSTVAHNQILRIIDTSKDYETFVKRLNNWAEDRLESGKMGLPIELRR